MGIKKGDMVLIYMPMIPEAVIAMLAVARLGAIHSVVFGGFAPHELSKRIVDCKPKVILTASHGIERSDKIISYLPLVSSAVQESKFSPQCIINYDRSKDYSLFSSASTTSSESVSSFSVTTARDIPVLSWTTLTDQIESKNKLFENPVPVKSTDPLYVLYTSGTTGQPKGVVRDNGGYSVALAWSMKNIFGINKGDRWFAASDIGWVVGHSYIVYAPLLAGATTILYEGKPVGTPDAGAYWRLIEEYGIKSMFTAPTALRAIKKEDAKGELIKHYNIRTLRNVWVAGERCDPDTTNHFRNVLGKDILDHWWQTETGWPITGYIQPQSATSFPSSSSKSFTQSTIPCKVGSAGLPIPGYKVEVLSTTSSYDNPIPAHANELGYVVIKLPLPPGCFNTLLGNHEGFVKSYLSDFKGYYNTSDSGYMDEDGYLYIMSRTDDVLNIAGHRLSTGAIEEVIAEHTYVAETAVVGLRDPLKGNLLCTLCH
ncbi:hypothetical protein BKA69DRAFT_1106770 [Paraphysoderma sedebokerense]|nr:hypothetical protein BKA69DRAFT_1106770 [Paraphysoderma sedebokerense]